jgi:hypothetical protein
MSEVEVFRTKLEMDTHYAVAWKTRTEGEFPNERYFTANPLQYVGKYVERVVGMNDESKVYECFDNNGITTKVKYEEEGNICFRPLTASMVERCK